MTPRTTEGPPYEEVIPDVNVLAGQKSSPRSMKGGAPAPALGALGETRCRKRARVNNGGQQTSVQNTFCVGQPRGQCIDTTNDGERQQLNQAEASDDPIVGVWNTRIGSKPHTWDRANLSIARTTTTLEGAEEGAATTMIAEKVDDADHHACFASFALAPRIVCGLQRHRSVTSASKMGDIVSSQERANGSVNIDVSSLSPQGTVRSKL